MSLAPVITKFPVGLEYELAKIAETENLRAAVGTIVNVSADEKAFSENCSMGWCEPVSDEEYALLAD